jgi:signal transduction histidine kinase
MAGPGVPADRIAHLEAVRRLSLGAAHTLNNAFTTLVGEASFLLGDRQHDPELAESLQVMLEALDRCTRITRGLLVRGHPNQDGSEVELVRVVRELGDLLHQTLGSRYPLTLEIPDDIHVVPGTAEMIELLVLSVVHYAADASGEHAELRVAVTAGGKDVALELDVVAPGLEEAAIEAFNQPRRAPDPVMRIVLESVADLVTDLGGARHAARTGPQSWSICVRLPEQT